MKTGTGSFLQSARLIAVLTMASRVLGLVRDIICLRYFGAVIWHYFSLGFTIPNLFRRLFGEGALTAALIPVYTQTLREGTEPARQLERSVVSLLALTLGVLTVLGLLILLGIGYGFELSDKAILTVQLAAIMLPYMLLICVTATFGGLLQVHRRFGPPALTPIVLNLCIIVTVLWLSRQAGADRWEQIFYVAGAVVAAGFLQAALQMPSLGQVGVSLRPTLNFGDPNLRKVVRLMGPMMLGMSVYQFNVLLDSVLAYSLSATEQSGQTFSALGREIAYPVVEGSISYLYLSQRLYQLPLGVFGTALATAVFPLLSRQAGEQDLKGLGATVAQGIRLVFFLAVPSAVGLVLIGVPLLQVFFEGGASAFTPYDTQETFHTLRFYALGLPFLFLQQLVVRVYYAFEDAKTPVRVAMVVVGLNLVLNLVLIWPLGTGGLALATVIGAAVQALTLIVLLLRRYRLQLGAGIGKSLVKTVVAATAMAGGCVLLVGRIDPASAVLRMGLTLAACVGFYMAASWLLKNRELSAALRDK